MILTKYVAGFLFSGPEDLPDVLLIRKNRPAWQKGLLNAVGGHVNLGESPITAMAREFKEETGLCDLFWTEVTQLVGSDFRVFYYRAWATPEVFAGFKSMTDEMLVPINLRNLFTEPVVPDLRVLIPLALDRTGIVTPGVIRTAFVPVRPSRTKRHAS